MSDSKASLLAKNTLYLYTRMILVLLVTLYTTRVVIEVLGIEDFGIYNIVGGVVVFMGFLKTALTNATYRFLAYTLGENNEAEVRNIYSMAINCHVILALLLWILMEAVGVWFINTHLNIAPERMTAANWVFQFSLLTFCVSIVQTPFHSNIIAHERMSFYAIISVVEVVVKLGIVYLLSWSPFDKLISYAALLLGTSLLIFSAYIFYCTKAFKETTYKKYWNGNVAKRLFAYSGWSMLVNGADVTANQCISIFFNWFVGVVGNAALGISNQVNSGINMFVANFSQAFNPQIIKSYASKEYDYFMKLIFTTTKISFILYIIIAIPISLNIDYILTVWLGEYPEMTSSLVKATMIYYLFDSFQIPLWQAVHATGNLKIHQIMIGTIKLLAIPLSYLAFVIGGTGGVVLMVWASLNGLCAVGRTIYMHKLINLDLTKYFRIVAKLFIMGIVSIPFPVWIIQNVDSHLVGGILSTLTNIIIVIILSLEFVFDKEEMGLLRYLPVVGKLFKKL